MLRIIILFSLVLALLAQPVFAQNPRPRKKAPPKGNTFSPPPPANAAPVKLKKTKLTPVIEAALPANFKVMPDHDLAEEYPTWKKPLAAFTDPQGNVDFIVTERKTDFPSKDMALLQQFYKASIMNMFTDVEFISERIQKVNGKDYLMLEFSSLMTYDDKDMSAIKKPVRKYNYIMYTIDDAQKKMNIFTLQTPIALRNTWQNVAPEIMTSVRLKAPKTKPGEQKPTRTTYE